MDKLLTEAEVARELLAIEPTLLERLRAGGKGPPAIRISDRVIRYRPSDVQHWIENRAEAAT
jgi:predicted DNA-binding transcriptional regulator AlpA